MEKSQVYGNRGVRRHRSFMKWAHRVREWSSFTSLAYGKFFWLKSTGNPCSCWGCGNPRRIDGGTLQEKAAAIGDREDWSRRKRRKGFRKVRISCVRCGYLLGFEEVPFGGYVPFGRCRRLCKGCREKERA